MWKIQFSKVKVHEAHCFTLPESLLRWQTHSTNAWTTRKLKPGQHIEWSPRANKAKLQTKTYWFWRLSNWQKKMKKNAKKSSVDEACQLIMSCTWLLIKSREPQKQFQRSRFFCDGGPNFLSWDGLEIFRAYKDLIKLDSAKWFLPVDDRRRCVEDETQGHDIEMCVRPCSRRNRPILWRHFVRKPRQITNCIEMGWWIEMSQGCLDAVLKFCQDEGHKTQQNQ